MLEQVGDTLRREQGVAMQMLAASEGVVEWLVLARVAKEVDLLACQPLETLVSS